MLSKSAAQQVLENDILRFWQERMVDNQRGGFYGRIDGQNTLHPDAEKGAVLNARILWTFSAAYRVLGKPEYLAMATRAKEYILAHFLDSEHGGCYWSLHADGSPLDTKKQTYAIGFMIYGFSEYARATGDEEAKAVAIRLFHDIEDHAFVSQKVLTGTPKNVESQKPIEGYVEALTREWQPIADMRLSDKDENAAFTMNTHLHILEPYTNLYRIWPDESLRQCIVRLISIFTDRLYNPENQHVDCFFDDKWNGRRDIASYGHDIEAAWLLNEASIVESRKSKVESTVSEITARIAEASLEGLQPDGSMEHEDKDASRQWWVECEAVVGFVDQWQLTGDETWFKRAQRTWDYLTTHLIDREHGEFYWAILPDGSIDRENDKAGFWKCPYHNSRMCMELMERL
ncbi:MAG: AGE family epimerase/isomerase [Paludibacteraceae bacterium]|nr:AGE family epimerase/isomerase [Paludibacteraceae bacterium]